MLDLKSNNRGFTLLEVMIVALVLSIMAGMTVMTFQKVRDTAWTKLCCANQKVIYGAAVMYTLNESDPLNDMGGNKAQLDALIDRGYLKSERGFECPSSPTADFDDYSMVFEGDYVTDIECTLDPEGHKWP
ncbi:MAG: prepilin-type N-terminal cleavage/methylation domain-containing protein [Candidatus Omnitrophota bacterium]